MHLNFFVTLLQCLVRVVILREELEWKDLDKSFYMGRRVGLVANLGVGSNWCHEITRFVNHCSFELTLGNLLYTPLYIFKVSLHWKCLVKIAHESACS